MLTLAILLVLQLTVGPSLAEDSISRRFLVDSYHWGQWSQYTVCDKCPGGTKQRQRYCLNGNGARVPGQACQQTGGWAIEFTQCDTSDCSSTTGECKDMAACDSHSCQYYARPHIECRLSCGYCGSSVSTTHTSPVDGHWGAWSTFTSCTVTCGTGYIYRHRTCNNPPPSNGGRPCTGSSRQFTTCHRVSCQAPTTAAPPVNGNWGAWSTTTSCSVTCGPGTFQQHRSCNNPPPSNGGHGCHGSSVHYVTCHARSCPVDGGWSTWSIPSTCSVTCGTGSATRTRTCSHPAPSHGGRTCSGQTSISVSCHDADCKVDGHWGPWGQFSACTETCGVGTRTKYRSCNNPVPQHGGHTCAGQSYIRELCNNTACVVDGGWTTWSSWTSCSKTCDMGVIQRQRSCTNPAPAGGGKSCQGGATDTHDCSQGPCAVWSHWFEGKCSVTCGSGTAERLRHCSTGHDEDCTGVAYENVPCDSGVACL